MWKIFSPNGIDEAGFYWVLKGWIGTSRKGGAVGRIFQMKHATVTLFRRPWRDSLASIVTISRFAQTIRNDDDDDDDDDGSGGRKTRLKKKKRKTQ